jgi:hypothetical protein
MARIKVQTRCEACGGTGLYSGMCEGKGKAVVCLSCDGSGCETIWYEPFTKRRGRTDIKTVILGRATRSILETNAGKEEVPYKKWFDSTK